jgi:hypothetical protein
MSAAMWKKEDGTAPQPTPSWALYTDAANKFRSSAEAFMEHVPLLTEARSAYQEAMLVSAELRNRLDASDEALKSVMTQLEQVVNDHLDEPALDRKKPRCFREKGQEAGRRGSLRQYISGITPRRLRARGLRC